MPYKAGGQFALRGSLLTALSQCISFLILDHRLLLKLALTPKLKLLVYN